MRYEACVQGCQVKGKTPVVYFSAFHCSVKECTVYSIKTLTGDLKNMDYLITMVPCKEVGYIRCGK